MNTRHGVTGKAWLAARRLTPMVEDEATGWIHAEVMGSATVTTGLLPRSDLVRRYFLKHRNEPRGVGGGIFFDQHGQRRWEADFAF